MAGNGWDKNIHWLVAKPPIPKVVISWEYHENGWVISSISPYQSWESQDGNIRSYVHPLVM